ncbi:sulfotransferase [Vannielia litorea]|uniref:sulfotransferase n=1 Tax=Vannielia litorea TaxID=1217970 RepID=UPI001C944634|nr:sulfotransferase [Vannielia litorea]MBY6048010.1 sulfotransferase [Vannielia litorea]MBY6075424.1 sulfotransferase [Vannielia litorea]
MSKVDLIIGGYERGGTTLLSEIFRANGFESGFECGVLLADQPSEFPLQKRYYQMLRRGWRISEETRTKACQGDFDHFYQTICNAAFPDFTGRFFDKTPRYMREIGACMHRYRKIKSAVIIHRDPRAVMASISKRMEPGLNPEEAIRKNFSGLVQRYLNYFIGCAAHFDNANVLFVPFEDLVSREEAWRKQLGVFATGHPFSENLTASRFKNVENKGLSLAKVMEFDRLLSGDLQHEILAATRMASVFFADATDRAKHGDEWAETKAEIRSIMAKFELPRSMVLDDGTYFEPFTYLLRNEGIRKAGRNPLAHYKRHGKKEGRSPH